jgi:hypothetical protein
MFFFACIYQPLGAVAHSDTLGLFADFLLPILRVLAVVAVAVLTTYKDQGRER